MTNLRDENNRLRNALAPFAAVARVIDFYVLEAVPESVVYPLPGTKMDPDGPGRVELRPEHFLAARDAMWGFHD